MNDRARAMGNCVCCYYATKKRKDRSCACARYPRWVDVMDMDNHFCGEFVFESGVEQRPVVFAPGNEVRA